MNLINLLKPQIAFGAAGGGSGGGRSGPTRPQARPDNLGQSRSGGGKGGSSDSSRPQARGSSAGSGGKGANRANDRWERSVNTNPTEADLRNAAPKGMTWDGSKYVREGSAAPESSPRPQARPDNLGIVSSPTTNTNTRSAPGPVTAPETVSATDGVGGGRTGGAAKNQKAGKLNEANARINDLKDGAEAYATKPEQGKSGSAGSSAPRGGTAGAAAEAARAARNRVKQSRNTMRISRGGSGGTVK